MAYLDARERRSEKGVEVYVAPTDAADDAALISRLLEARRGEVFDKYAARLRQLGYCITVRRPPDGVPVTHEEFTEGYRNCRGEMYYHKDRFSHVRCSEYGARYFHDADAGWLQWDHMAYLPDDEFTV